jgi:hypothetical protein
MSYSKHQLSRAQRRQFVTTNPAGGDAGTYAGELADFFVAPALKAADTIANGYVTQLDGISNKAVVTGASIADDLIQEGACGFNDGDSVTVDERVLTLNDLMVNEKLCRKSILPYWNSVKGSRNSDWGTPEFRNFVLAQVAAKVAEGVEQQIWNGKDYTTSDTLGFLSGTGTFDRTGAAAGILKPANGAGSASAANGVAITSLTANNVITEMGAVYAYVATNKSPVMTKPDFAFYVGPKTAALYRQALTTAGGAALQTGDAVGQGYQNQVTNQAINGLNYLGVPIYMCPGIPADAIVAACVSNLFVGSNLRTDYTEATYIPLYQYDGSDNVAVTYRFGLGMQAGILSEVTVGTTAGILPA